MCRMHFIAMVLCCSFFAAPAHADEDPESLALCEQVQPLMAADDYPALDAMAKRFRTGERTSSGESKLGRFYLCMSRQIGTDRQDGRYWDHWTAWAGRWIERAPRSPSAHLMMARVPLNRGWSIRGDDVAGKVGDEDWAPYRQYTAEAGAYLAAHKAAARHDPFWYEMAAVIALRQDADPATLMAIVDEGLQAHPGYDPLYFIGMHAATPLWGGSVEAMEAFARHAMTRAPKAYRPALYARLYWAGTGGYYGAPVYHASRVDWPLMRRGLDDILARYPTAWNLQGAVRYACLAGDRPQLEKWFAMQMAALAPGLDVPVTDAMFAQNCAARPEAGAG